MHKELEIFLPELVELERLSETVIRRGRMQVEERIRYKKHELPVYSIVFGPEDRSLPTLALVAGVHGLERIGTRVVIAYLRSLCRFLEWDELTHAALERCRIVFYPIVNPGGMMATTRSNPNGVDLMRNAPVEMESPSPWRIFEGHRLSARLPWFRGTEPGKMEPEAAALCRFIEREVWPSRWGLSLDVHSGFGMLDRFWFPYAKTRKPFPRIAETFRLKELLDSTYPNHVYRVEPQSHQYTTHGDLWDYLFDRHREEVPDRLFLPFCLEMGSWMWVKKNPMQLFSVLGAFNPEKPHRKRRALRRHLLLFDFLLRATLSAPRWAGVGEAEREEVNRAAVGHWYGK